MSSKEYHLS